MRKRARLRAEASSCFKAEAERNETFSVDDFQKGEIQEEDLREVLDYYSEVRERYGFGNIMPYCRRKLRYYKGLPCRTPR